jgi:hypothetical protein
MPREPLGLRDLALVLGIVALAGALRVTWFGGLGLGDDLVFRGEIGSIVVSSRVAPDNQAYRFMWWLPVAVSARLLGMGSLGLVLPFTIASLVGLAFVYLVGRELWGRPGGVLAALLAAFTPIDFVWSTVMTPDIMLSATWAALVWLVLRALDAVDEQTRRRAWFWAAVAFWLSLHTKLSGLFIAPALALALLVERRRLTAEVTTFFATALALVTVSLVASYALWGDPIFAYSSEIKFQNLSGTAETVRQLQRNEFWHFPERLTLPDRNGDLYFGVLPYAAVLLPMLALAAGRRARLPLLVWGWLVFPVLALQFNVQRVDGVWAAGFRNIRHILPLAYPMAVITAGALVAIGRRWRPVAGVLAAVVLGVGLWDSISLARKMHWAFVERREVCRFLASLPRKPIRLEPAHEVWCGIDPPVERPDLVKLHPNPEPRQIELRGVTEGYVVTGGAIEPVYGCAHCVPLVADMPANGFRLVHEIDGPIEDPWRRENLRIWERVPDAPPTNG